MLKGILTPAMHVASFEVSASKPCGLIAEGQCAVYRGAAITWPEHRMHALSVHNVRPLVSSEPRGRQADSRAARTEVVPQLPVLLVAGWSSGPSCLAPRSEGV